MMITSTIENYSKNPINKSGKSIFSFFQFFSQREEKSYTVTRRRRKKERAVKQISMHCDAPEAEQKEVYLDLDGNAAECRIENNKILTADGCEFTGTSQKSDSRGRVIKTRYKNGCKTFMNLGDGRLKLYSEKSTKIIEKNLGIVSGISFNESITKKYCSSLIYFDSEIKFASIDFTSGQCPVFKKLEIRQDGQASGIIFKNGRWQAYCIENGRDLECSENAKNTLYSKVKTILNKTGENIMLAENMDVQKIEQQIDGIFSSILEDKELAAA